MRRRNVLLGLGALVFGSGSFIASGAFGGDQSDSRGNWDQASEFDGSAGGDLRVQTIADPDNTNSRFQALERDDIGVTRSSIVQEDESGFVAGIQFESLNSHSTTRVGRLDTHGNVDQANAAFLIANLGGVENDATGEAVELQLRLYDDTATDERSIVQPNNAVRFLYTIPERNQNGNLLEEDGVVVDPEEVVCVTIEVNSGGSGIYEQVEAVELTIRDPDEE